MYVCMYIYIYVCIHLLREGILLEARLEHVRGDHLGPEVNIIIITIIAISEVHK